MRGYAIEALASSRRISDVRDLSLYSCFIVTSGVSSEAVRSIVVRKSFASVLSPF
jgi:hypothetical protein